MHPVFFPTSHLFIVWTIAMVFNLGEDDKLINFKIVRAPGILLEVLSILFIARNFYRILKSNKNSSTNSESPGSVAQKSRTEQ